MTDPATPAPTTTRLKRLCQFLVVLALLWGAVTIYRWLVPPDPLAQARAAVDAAQLDVAVEHYLRHLTTQPNDGNARLELGVLLSAFDRQQALAEFRKIPDDSEAYMEACRQVATICLASERFREAEVALQVLAQRLPDDATVQLLLAELYFRQHRAKVALPHAQRSVELDPTQPRAQFLLAELHDDLGHPAEMIPPLRQILTQTPEDYATHLNLCYAYTEAGQAAEARREAEWCLARNPNDVFARRYRALALRDLGDHQEAMEEIQRALTLAPDDLACRLLEAELLLFDNQSEQAWERLAPLYEQAADNRRLVALLARAAATAGRDEDARKYREQLQKLSE